MASFNIFNLFKNMFYNIEGIKISLNLYNVKHGNKVKFNT